MLKGIPIPPGFKSRPKADGATRDRYQLGARVAGAVVCGWIDRHYAGDPNAAKALDTARASGRSCSRWTPRATSPRSSGSTPTRSTARGNVPGGKLGLTVDGAYKDALGC